MVASLIASRVASAPVSADTSRVPIRGIAAKEFNREQEMAFRTAAVFGVVAGVGLWQCRQVSVVGWETLVRVGRIS